MGVQFSPGAPFYNMKKEDPEIDKLRKLGKWPFPLWQDGKIVIVRVKKEKKGPPWEVGEALM